MDRSLILRKFAELEEYLGQVREYAAITLDEYTGDWRSQRIVERTLQIMIELCVDICNHIIADKRLRVPTSYADSFRVLFEAGLLSEFLLGIMDKMAKFRNIVVHHYDRVDDAIVVTILRKHLDDFMAYRDAILHILETREKV